MPPRPRPLPPPPVLSQAPTEFRGDLDLEDYFEARRRWEYNEASAELQGLDDLIFTSTRLEERNGVLASVDSDDPGVGAEDSQCVETKSRESQSKMDKTLSGRLDANLEETTRNPQAPFHSPVSASIPIPVEQQYKLRLHAATIEPELSSVSTALHTVSQTFAIDTVLILASTLQIQGPTGPKKGTSPPAAGR